MSDQKIQELAQDLIDYLSRGGEVTAWWSRRSYDRKDRARIVEAAAAIRGKIYR